MSTLPLPGLRDTVRRALRRDLPPSAFGDPLPDTHVQEHRDHTWDAFNAFVLDAYRAGKRIIVPPSPEAAPAEPEQEQR